MMENLSRPTDVITRVAKGEVWIAYDEKSDKKRPFVIMSDELSGIDLDKINEATREFLGL